MIEARNAVRLDGIGHYLDIRTECALLAALRHLADSIRTGSDAMSDGIDDIMMSGGGIVPLSADEIDAFADALSSDTWLCQTATPPVLGEA